MSDCENDIPGISKRLVTEVKIGEFVMIDGHPCILTSYTDCKCSCISSKRWLYGSDLVSSQKYDMVWAKSWMIECPIVNLTDYELLSIDFDDFCTLNNDEGVLRDDLKLPHQATHEFVKSLRENYQSERPIRVSVISVLGNDAIYGFTVC